MASGLFIDHYDQDAHTEGADVAMRLFEQATAPYAPTWEDVAPDWALETTPRAYAWRRGFITSWNFWCGNRGWPDSARLRYVFKRRDRTGLVPASACLMVLAHSPHTAPDDRFGV